MINHNYSCLWFFLELTELFHLFNFDPDDDLKVWGYAKHIITHGRRHHVADKRKGHHPDEQGDGEDSDHGEN